MSDLVARALGAREASTLRPRLPSVFEPARTLVSQLVDAPNMLVSAFLPEDIFTS